jgi:hypothetical protein
MYAIDIDKWGPPLAPTVDMANHNETARQGIVCC